MSSNVRAPVNVGATTVELVEREPAGVGSGIVDRHAVAFDLGTLVRLDHSSVLGVELGEERRRVGRRRAASRSRRRARLASATCTTGAVRVGRRHAQRGVDPAGGRAADQQRDREVLALHLAGDVHHLVERRSDQTRRGR